MGAQMQTWCIDCRMLSPKTESLYELGVAGWRAMRSLDGARFEWRCPACWGVFKEVMADSEASSARFTAAPPIDEALANDVADWGKSGERPVSAADDTLPNNRPDMISRLLHSVFDALSQVPPSSRVRELRRMALKCQSIVSHWVAAPPTREEQLRLFDDLARLHADASALLVVRGRATRR